jgi:uncharacterized membrane protein
MAEHSASGPSGHAGGIDEHRAAYRGFLTGAIATMIMVGFTMVALVSFSFGHSLNVFLGFLGLVLGLIGVLIDARMGSKRWGLSLVLLVIFGLVTAMNVA